jgi:hypothetical protein
MCCSWILHELLFQPTLRLEPCAACCYSPACPCCSCVRALTRVRPSCLVSGTPSRSTLPRTHSRSKRPTCASSYTATWAHSRAGRNDGMPTCCTTGWNAGNNQTPARHNQGFLHQSQATSRAGHQPVSSADLLLQLYFRLISDRFKICTTRTGSIAIIQQ